MSNSSNANNASDRNTEAPSPQRAHEVELTRLERRMERKWYDLAMAEQRNQPTHVLERMYDAYVRALDEYIQGQRGTRDGHASGGATRLAS